jgi:hypothetical protein
MPVFLLVPEYGRPASEAKQRDVIEPTKVEQWEVAVPCAAWPSPMAPRSSAAKSVSALMAEAASWGRPKTWRRGEEKRLKQMHVVAIEDMDRVAAERGMCSAQTQPND